MLGLMWILCLVDFVIDCFPLFVFISKSFFGYMRHADHNPEFRDKPIIHKTGENVLIGYTRTGPWVMVKFVFSKRRAGENESGIIYTQMMKGCILFSLLCRSHGYVIV